MVSAKCRGRDASTGSSATPGASCRCLAGRCMRRATLSGRRQAARRRSPRRGSATLPLQMLHGPVLQAARSWDQDAPREQPVAGRLDQVIGRGRHRQLASQQGRCEAPLRRRLQARAGRGRSWPRAGARRLPALVDRPQAGDGRRRYRQDLGGVSQEVSGSTLKPSSGRPATRMNINISAAGRRWSLLELLPDGRHLR